MANRFGATGTFYYASGDSLTGGTHVYLNAGQMPQYPFENRTVTDRTSYRSKGGKVWSYENYNLDSFTFSWSLVDSDTRGTLRRMYDALPILTFYSNSNNFGTMRFADLSWEDSEVAYGLYDVSFTLEETV